MALSFQDKIQPVPNDELSFATKIKPVSDMSINEGLKKPFVPTLPEKGFLAPTPKVRVRDVAREAINILGTGEMILGTALGGAAVPFTPEYKDLQETRKK